MTELEINTCLARVRNRLNSTVGNSAQSGRDEFFGEERMRDQFHKIARIFDLHRGIFCSPGNDNLSSVRSQRRIETVFSKFLEEDPFRLKGDIYFVPFSSSKLS